MYGRFTDGVPVTPIVGDWNNDGTDTVGVVYARDRFYWHLRNTNSTGTAHRIFRYGANDPAYVPGTGEGPVVGDWNGDGRDTPGLVRVTSTGKLRWLLRNRNTHGNADHVFVYGRSAAGVEALSWR